MAGVPLFSTSAVSSTDAAIERQIAVAQAQRAALAMPLSPAAQLAKDQAIASGMGYKIQICTFWQKNMCANGPVCTFAHGEHELLTRSGEKKDPSKNTEDTDLILNAVEDCCKKIQHLETEWDPDKLQKKIYEYLKKANKAAAVFTGDWQATCKEFVAKFYESCYHALGSRGWLDQADFSICIVLAIKDWLGEKIPKDTSQDSLMTFLGTECALSHDNVRYYSHAWEAMKKCVPNKMSQKKVQEAVDAARDITVKQGVVDLEPFLFGWTQKALEVLARDSPQKNPRLNLTESNAVVLFEELIQNGRGVPMWLDSMKPAPNSPDVRNAVAAAYSIYPEPRREDKDGKGKGKAKTKDGKDKGKTATSAGIDLANVDPKGFEQGMAAAAALQSGGMAAMLAVLAGAVAPAAGSGGQWNGSGGQWNGGDNGWDGGGHWDGGGKGWDGNSGGQWDGGGKGWEAGGGNGWDGGGKGWAPY